jgi:cytosine/adenosine deaminase-related metal-dependent hydrolase
MASLLIKNAAVVATMDDAGREIADCDVLIENGLIAAVGPGLAAVADETIDAAGCAVLPGFVNSHHHLFQTLYRAVPAVQQTDFVSWITHMSGMWLRTPPPPEAVYTAAMASFGELLITGCTATADQHYIYMEGQPGNAVDRTIDAAREVGIRFHPARGCCTMGASKGGLVRDEITQSEDVVLEHSAALIAKYHDPAPNAMVRMVLSPLGPYSDSETIYREMRVLADQHPGVGLHTHLHEVSDYDVGMAKYGIRPLDLMERTGWVGDRVVFYHMSSPAPNAHEIAQIARMGCHVSHCCGSDLALSYGLPPVRELLDAGAKVCLGTTGCASNLGGHILIEARLAFAVHRLRSQQADQWLSPREMLRMATRGGAEALGRPDLGQIAVGKGGDIAVFDMHRLDRVGNHDPLAALVMTGASHMTKATVVNGRVVARDGHLVGVDEDRIIRDAAGWAKRLVA